jgi:hypothetical protein
MSLVSRIGKIQGTGICLIGALFFSNNGINFKTIIKNTIKTTKKCLFFGTSSEFIKVHFNSTK